MKNPIEPEPNPPSRGQKHICLFFESEDHYKACVADLSKYRAHLLQERQRHPELFPQAFAGGFSFHDSYQSRKQKGLALRRIRLKQTREVFTLRPSFVLPYLIGRTEEVEKALYLRQWDVPFEAKHLVADEKITWVDKDEVSVATTVGGGCILGISIAENEDSAALQAAYGEFAAEASAVFPDYKPESVYTDGWKATREAWRTIFPGITLILCFLHSILNIRERCRGELRHKILDRAWRVYQAVDKRSFAQRTRRLREWSQKQLTGVAATMVEKLCARCESFLPAYDFRERRAPRMRWIGISTRCSTVTARKKVRDWRCERWRCSGTFIRMGNDCVRISRRGFRRLRTSMASSITKTGYRTFSSLRQ